MKTSQKKKKKIEEKILEKIWNFEERFNELNNSIANKEIYLLEETKSFSDVGLMEDITEKISYGSALNHRYTPYVLKIINDIGDIKASQDRLLKLFNDSLTEIKQACETKEIDVNDIIEITKNANEKIGVIYSKSRGQINILTSKGEKEKMGGLQRIHQILDEKKHLYDKLSYMSMIREFLDKLRFLLSEYTQVNFMIVGGEIKGTTKKYIGIFNEINKTIEQHYEEEAKEVEEEEMKIPEKRLPHLQEDIWKRVDDGTWENIGKYHKETGVTINEIRYAIRDLQQKGRLESEPTGRGLQKELKAIKPPKK